MKWALFSDKAEQSRHRSAEAPSLNLAGNYMWQVIMMVKAGTEIRYSPDTSSGCNRRSGTVRLGLNQTSFLKDNRTRLHSKQK